MSKPQIERVKEYETITCGGCGGVKIFDLPAIDGFIVRCISSGDLLVLECTRCGWRTKRPSWSAIQGKKEVESR